MYVIALYGYAGIMLSVAHSDLVKPIMAWFKSTMV